MRTLVRTFHIEEDLDRRMAEAVFRSVGKERVLTKTAIVNEALRVYFKVNGAAKQPLLKTEGK